MTNEREHLLDTLSKIKALYEGAKTEGERVAAQAAMQRVEERLKNLSNGSSSSFTAHSTSKTDSKADSKTYYDGNTLVVPDMYKTLAEAVQNAVHGNTILLRAGVYNENQKIVIKKSVTIRSSTNHFKDVELRVNHPIEIESNNVCFRGIFFHGSNANCFYYDLKNTQFENCKFTARGEKAETICILDYCTPVFTNCVFSGCTNRGLSFYHYCEPCFKHCSFENNVYEKSSAVSISTRTKAVFTACRFFNNHSDVGFHSDGTATFNQCSFEGTGEKLVPFLLLKWGVRPLMNVLLRIMVMELS